MFNFTVVQDEHYNYKKHVVGLSKSLNNWVSLVIQSERDDLLLKSIY